MSNEYPTHPLRCTDGPENSQGHRRNVSRALRPPQRLIPGPGPAPASQLLAAAALAVVLACLSPAAAAQTESTRSVHDVPLFMRHQPGEAQQGFIRVANRSNRDGQVTILAYDDQGEEHGPVTFPLNARQTKGLNSTDLEMLGGKGLSGTIGPGRGDWRLVLTTDLNVRVRAYVRNPSPEGWFVTSMHDAAPVDPNGPGRYNVPFINPASNAVIASRLRLVNPHGEAAAVVVEGFDANGERGRESIRLSIPPRAARTITAQEMESGGGFFQGAFGDGAGKWELYVTSDRTLHVMGLLQTSSGHLANLSSAPALDRAAARGGFDVDVDGLIEVFFLEQLDAVRHDLDGDGRADSPVDADAYAAAFPDAAEGAYRGYELARPLDFEDAGSYASGEVNGDWVRGGPTPETEGWEPIGRWTSDDDDGSHRGFEALFDGNGHAIRNLFIYRENNSRVGLFGSLGDGRPGSGEIRNFGLIDVNVKGRKYVGGLVGLVASGLVRACYVAGGNIGDPSYSSDTGGLVGATMENSRVVASYAAVDVTGYWTVGGLIGSSSGSVAASYAVGPVEAQYSNIGGLFGSLTHTGEVAAAYAMGEVQGQQVGGLVGRRESGGVIVNSYWNADIAGSTGVGQGSEDGAEGKTAAELTVPTGYEGIYAEWNLDLDGDGDPNDPWDFGTGRQHPSLKVDFDGDGVATWREFGDQPR